MRTAPYDKFEQIAFDAQLAVAIMGNPATGDFALLGIQKDLPLSGECLSTFLARGMFFCGTVGVVDGVTRSAFDVPLDIATMGALVAAFLQHLLAFEMRTRVEAKPKGDGAEFLQRLFALNDPRNSEKEN